MWEQCSCQHKEGLSHALTLIKESGDKQPDLEKKILSWMYNTPKGKYSVVGPGEEPAKEEAAD
jgi:hypothetical protein